MTVETTAAEIAARWVDESKRHRLELDILRHMEHHIRVEAEACAKIADVQAITSDDEARQETAEIIAGAIRSRFTR